MKTGAICFGGYCPMHRGHLDLIMRAKKENDYCLVVVCGYDSEPRGLELGLDHSERLEIVKDIFSNDKQIQVIGISDTDLGIDQSMSISNWIIWTDEVIEHFPPDLEPVFYVAEEFYKSRLEDIGYSVKCFPKILNISGTLIRQNPGKFWNYIIGGFRKTRNILITGTASEGKTTLTRDIGTYFNIPIIEEYGRTFLEVTKMKDQDLGYKEFVGFLCGQVEILSAMQHQLCPSPIVISDTDGLVTLMYAKSYSMDPDCKITEKEYEDLENYFKSDILKDTTWDKIFLLPPKNDFVDDGIRYMKQSSMEERNNNYDILVDLLKKYGFWDKVEILNGNYFENYEKVRKYINSYI